MEKLIDIRSYPVAPVLKILLTDKTTKKNIIWATDSYAEYGKGFQEQDELLPGKLLRHPEVIAPRILKSQEKQAARTRQKAEVFTPAWLCNQMNNYCDQEYLGRGNVFNIETPNHTWVAIEQRVEFPAKTDWKHYVDSRRLEITCGEAPYLVSRYDVATGETIPISQRIGMLDRKLRVVNENTDSEVEWQNWATRALESCYGYEFQGDSLLIARINILCTMVDYYKARFGRPPEDKLLRHLAHRIAWNIWQMDGLTRMVPLRKSTEDVEQPTFKNFVSSEKLNPRACRIFNWRGKFSLEYNNELAQGSMDLFMTRRIHFIFVIGNPPYQEDFENSGENGNFGKPVYHLFMNSAFEVGDKVELIHPARFLFNAGSTPKTWNEKMLNDEHFKVLYYEPDSAKLFPNTSIMGGVAITYRDENKKFTPVGIFLPNAELNSILQKVVSTKSKSFSKIVMSAYVYHFTEKLHEEHPEAMSLLSNGHAFDLKSNVLVKLSYIFTDDKPTDGKEYIQIFGLSGASRISKYIRREYVNMVDNLDKYKVFVPAANGAGALGEVPSTSVIGQPVIAMPQVGHTETFMSIGTFDTETEAKNCLKYVKSKFARVLLGILKVTQHNPPGKWRYVPLQDFTGNSDIDWSKSIAEIDRQLYKKYGLDEKEIEFIETRVKEME